MSDSTSSTASAATGTVSFSVQDALNIATTLGQAVTLIDPAAAGGVAAITGIADLISNVVLPAIQKFQTSQWTIAQQAQLAAASAVERTEVGAPTAVSN